MKRIYLFIVLVACAASPTGVCANEIPDQIRQSVIQNAWVWNLPPELVLGVIKVESGFNPRARSPKGAIGLMQVVPKSGGREIWKILYNEEHTPSRSLLETPHANITLGTAYLSYLYYRQFQAIEDEGARTVATLAAYNWGPTRVQKLVDRHGVPKSSLEMYRLLIHHSPRETSHYVVSVLSASNAYYRQM